MQGHHALTPDLRLLLGAAVRHFGGGGALLRGIGKNARARQLLLAQELLQLLQLRLPLAGQPNDQARADGNAGNARAQFAKKLCDRGLRLPPAHGLENGIVYVLDGDVKIAHDLLLARDQIDQLIIDLIGIQIVQTDPLDAVHLHKLAQKRGKIGAKIAPIAADILRHKDQLLHAALGERAGFIQNVLHRS